MSAAAIVKGVRTCRLCGCTDSKPCMDEFGLPCSWALPDLCSACVPEWNALCDPLITWDHEWPADGPMIDPLVIEASECQAQRYIDGLRALRGGAA